MRIYQNIKPSETELRTEEKLDGSKHSDEKINFINQTYHERLEELNTTVKEFIETEIPKHSKMLVESKQSQRRVKERKTIRKSWWSNGAN